MPVREIAVHSNVIESQTITPSFAGDSGISSVASTTWSEALEMARRLEWDSADEDLTGAIRKLVGE